ncbi:hypothetical protein N836_32445 [Leptolyngbya sp. Heron Island J]|uniref:hypothetical protein n=1 Tax=Leptolyngbya sp. Heron Island J TaxID=1385935 RepID=UPI0003B9DD08|nr:hypothetical protein [Leptolyngbya sp. Heron Island J]ESA38144.1 hypothetical protein N836_32445 [Leptolyngbya sp. Heron Island J]
MSKSGKWKSKLISSSLPLEFEAAKFLVSQGFSVSADYTYARDDSGVVKDFSVDLQATAYLPFSQPDRITAQLDLLIECKQRNPNVRWLFLPDPNPPDFSPITFGRTIRAIDNFSLKFFRPSATTDFDASIKHCYKGTEIDESNGNVYDSELKHGISQLQYALPRLLAETALDNLRKHEDDNIPFLICPILLTTADLMVAKRNLDTSMIESAQCLSDISKSVPYLVLYSDYGPDFQKHCIKECIQLGKIESKILDKFDRKRFEAGEYSSISTSFLCQCLAEGMRADLVDYFTQFVICQTSSLKSLIRDIKKISSISARTLRAYK